MQVSEDRPLYISEHEMVAGWMAKELALDLNDQVAVARYLSRAPLIRPLRGATKKIWERAKTIRATTSPPAYHTLGGP